MFGAPILAIINALIAFIIAFWISKRPKHSFIKALIIWIIAFTIAFTYQIISTSNVLDYISKWASPSEALEYYNLMWVSWVIILVIFAIYPQLGSYFLAQSWVKERKQSLLYVQPLMTIAVISTSVLIYSFIAILFMATPD